MKKKMIIRIRKVHLEKVTLIYLEHNVSHAKIILKKNMIVIQAALVSWNLNVIKILKLILNKCLTKKFRKN